MAHRRWMANLKFDQPVHYIVLQDCIAAVEAAKERRDHLEGQIMAALPEWSLAQALQALRGIAQVAAATLAAELGDITRFSNPRQLMTYRLGAIGAVERMQTPSGRNNQSGQCGGPANADRGGVELPLPGSHQPTPTRAAGASAEADP